jgi:hypothetical protein
MSVKRKRCACEGCQLARRCSRAAKVSGKVVQDLLNDLFGAYEHEGMDHGYWKARYDGTWPSEIGKRDEYIIKGLEEAAKIAKTSYKHHRNHCQPSCKCCYGARVAVEIKARAEEMRKKCASSS